jgi:hypothetical protein
MMPPTGPQERPLGAYGLRLEGIGAARSLLVPADPNWPTLEMRSEIGSPPWRDSDIVSDADAKLRLQTGGEIRMERATGLVVFTMQRPLGEREMIHPYLAPVAAVAGYWFDRESFHAGAFVADGSTWAVLGVREAGKSTLLAALALRGITVVSDDMLILDAGTPFAAPRVIDLRPSAAHHLGVGESLGIVGARERWRLQLGPVEHTFPLRGWIFPEWGDRVEASGLSPPERIARLSAQRGLRLRAKDPSRLLDLASLPAWELRRPREWDDLDASTDLLLDLVRSSAT